MIPEGLVYNKTITMETVQCCNCGVVFGIPSDLNERFQNDPEMWFHCPNGHRQHYSKSKEERLREETEKKLREAQEALWAKNYALEEKDATINSLQKQYKKQKKQLTRVSNGVCPCCNRTFVDLQRHMESKHPEQIKKTKAK